MKKIAIFLAIVNLLACNTSKEKTTETVATFKGQQVTGVTVSSKGRIFANFPRWRNGVKNPVVEVKNGKATSYPNKDWNGWKIGDSIANNTFVAVQSVVANDNILYVLDTKNPLFKGVQLNPTIYAFNLETDKLLKTYILSEKSFHKNSYINDLRIDKRLNKMYLTDSGHAGLVVVDLISGENFRVLDNHTSTLAETDQLSFSNGVWKNTVHSDGIALDTNNQKLYFHALTGYSLYSIDTDILASGNNEEIENNVQFVAKTSAPDGMIIDNSGNLYLSDLENNKILKYNISNKTLNDFIGGAKVKWADTFSIYNDYLYYTNSRINEASNDISDLEFSIEKVKL